MCHGANFIPDDAVKTVSGFDSGAQVVSMLHIQ